MFNHRMINTDTDAILICKEDQSPWSEQEQEDFLKALNAQFPDLINFEHDGYYSGVIVLKAKNYILKYHNNGEVIFKGSSFSDSKKELALRELMKEMIGEMLEENNQETLISIYNKYVLESLNVQDINRWSQKKTVTEAITNCKKTPGRKQEQDVWDAVKDDNPQQGDKVHVYPTILGQNVISGRISEKTGKPLRDLVEDITGLKQAKYWNNDHNVDHLLKRCYDTILIFENVIDMDKFVDYTKKSNKGKLEELKKSIK